MIDKIKEEKVEEHDKLPIGETGMYFYNVKVSSGGIGKIKSHHRSKFGLSYLKQSKFLVELYLVLQHIALNDGKGVLKRTKWELYPHLVDELIRIGKLTPRSRFRKRILASILYSIYALYG